MSVKGLIHLYVGDDEYAVRKAAQQLLDSLVPEAERAFGLEVIEGRVDKQGEAVATLKRCEEAFTTRGFLTVRPKVVWWRDVTFLADGMVAQAEEVKSRLKAFVQVLRDAPPDGNILLITAPKADKRGSLHRLCTERHTVKEFHIPEKSHEAGRYAQATLRQALDARRLRAGPEVIERFLERVGPDSRQIVSEVEKLALYVAGRQEVTEADVDAIISSTAESAMWDIQDAVGKRQLGRALGIVRNLLEHRESAIGVVTMVMNRLRELSVYREALDRGWLRLASGGKTGEWGDLEPDEEAMLTAGLKKPPRALHPFRVGLLAQQARLHTPAMIRRSQQVVMSAHEALVSSSVPEAIVLELMLTRLMAEGVPGGAGGRPAADGRIKGEGR